MNSTERFSELLEKGLAQQVVSELRQCCETTAPASISLPDSGVICHGRFVSLQKETLLFDLLDEPKVEVKPFSTCSVSYCLASRGFVFLSVVYELRPSDPTRLAQIVLKVPSQIARTESRKSIRVPVVDDNLQVQVASASEAWTARPVDISLGGMLVEFPSGARPSQDIGQRLRVDLQLGANAVTFEAEIRHFQGRQYGLSFSETMVDGEVNPPEPYRNIVGELERKWLQARIGDDG